MNTTFSFYFQLAWTKAEEMLTGNHPLRLTGSSLCIVLSLVQDLFPSVERCTSLLAFRADTQYRTLTWLYHRPAPIEKGPLDDIPPCK